MKNKIPIKDVLNKHLGHIKIDDKFYKAIKTFRINWATKDDIYIEFLGGNLTGMHPIRFSTLDEDMLFADTLIINRQELKEDVLYTSDIDTSRKVSSNYIYLTLTYLMYITINTKGLGRLQNEILKELYLIMSYKILGSLMSHYFTYDLDLATAKAVFDRLSNRYLIKKLGSWNEVLEHRSKAVVTGGLHYKGLSTYKTTDVEKAIADLQGRIRETIKNIYVVLIEVKKEGNKVSSTSIIEENEDGDKIKDTTNNPVKYINYIRSIVNQPNDFIDEDIIYLISSISKNLESDKLKEVLKYIATTDLKLKEDEDFIEVAVVNTISYLRTKNITSDYNKHIYDIINYMKGYWSSSSVKNKKIDNAKKYLNKLTIVATGKKTKWVVSLLTIAVLMYIFIRSLKR